jgi:hypothetical protein
LKKKANILKNNTLFIEIASKELLSKRVLLVFIEKGKKIHRCEGP